MVNKLKIEDSPRINQLRSITSQCIACISSNLLLLDLGMAVSFSTIAIPALLNAKEGLSLNDNQASWFGSITFITQPIGAILSGPLVDYFGRKKANFLANIPHVVAWVLMYFAWNHLSLFAAGSLLGLGCGIMEAPINSYVGEVSAPSLRGALCTATQMFTSTGIFIAYFLGVLVDWRTAALVCLAAPLAAMLSILMIPETPVWLLVHGRDKEALASLCYLRGWTTPENVNDEFQELKTYAKTLQQCVLCEKKDAKDCKHGELNPIIRTMLTFKSVMFSQETLRPFCLIMLYFIFSVMSGLAPIKPNLVNLCGAFGMPVDGKQVTLMVGVINFGAALITVLLIRYSGKRKLSLISLIATGVCSAALAGYAKTKLPENVFSYNPETFPKEYSNTPLVLLYLLTLFTGFAVPWVILGEIFNFRSRAKAQGLAAAGNYIVTFIGTKTFINLETSVGLQGTFGIYAAFSFVGAVYLYFYLPETEGKSLQEIESFYSGDMKTFADDPFINFFKRFKKKT